MGLREGKCRGRRGDWLSQHSEEYIILSWSVVLERINSKQVKGSRGCSRMTEESGTSEKSQVSMHCFGYRRNEVGKGNSCVGVWL